MGKLGHEQWRVGKFAALISTEIALVNHFNALALNMEYNFYTIFEGRIVSLCGQHSKTCEWSYLVDLVRHIESFH